MQRIRTDHLGLNPMLPYSSSEMATTVPYGAMEATGGLLGVREKNLLLTHVE